MSGSDSRGGCWLAAKKGRSAASRRTSLPMTSELREGVVNPVRAEGGALHSRRGRPYIVSVCVCVRAHMHARRDTPAKKQLLIVLESSSRFLFLLFLPPPFPRRRRLLPMTDSRLSKTHHRSKTTGVSILLLLLPPPHSGPSSRRRGKEEINIHMDGEKGGDRRRCCRRG